MKYKNTVSLLVVCIILLSLTASVYGVFSNEGQGQYEFKSLQGETVSIYGKGLYKNDSTAMAVQARAQDTITMFLGVPLLVISLYMARRNSLKGRLLLTGTLSYFLYSYVMYTFIAMYNQFFLVYVILMATALYAFVLAMLSFDVEELSCSFSEKLPVKLVGGFLLFLGAAVGLLWIGRIVPPLMEGTVPVGLEHYTTLVIQGLDLGIVIPAQFIAGVLLIRRKSFGYLLAPVMTVKLITLLTALTAMVVGQALAGVKMVFFEMAMFPLFNLMAIYCLAVILKNMKEKGSNKAVTPRAGGGHS
ncbi:MAG: hypothetical protein JL50_09000 [Peptococcaceae bacterium BICA1-7]|nr:MAG: hypothetical protein JL50_09000 [Peptococcaceae bacterium BICA1-7]HBV97198.1 hypothetical protein [Desulfotomaculum sp.]